jgi:hypothetical protein
MLIGKITKQPAERQNFYVQYGDYLQEGETLVSAVGTLDVVGELYLVGPVILPTEADVEFWLEDGIAGNSYKLEITVETSLGNRKQDEFKIKVKEI